MNVVRIWALGVLRPDLHIKMVSADQLAVTDKKYLYHRVAVIRRQRDNVLVLAVRVRNLLLLCDLSDTV